MKICPRDQKLILAAIQWLDTDDIFYRDTIKAIVDPLPSNPTDLEVLCHKSLVERPDDPYYRNYFTDAVAAIKADPRLLR